MGDDRVRDAVGDGCRAVTDLQHPLVIAHRGASGYLTEHTLAAKKLAHDQRADFLEQDVVATRDGVLIVCHDLHLERLTNVGDVFPDRCRDDGRYYVIDFDWSEIRSLQRHSIPENLADADATASRALADDFDDVRLHTLAEELEFIDRINAASTHSAGVYTEIKHPAWHREHGFDLTGAVARALDDAGFRRADGSAYIQCFDAAELRRLKESDSCPLPLVQLVGLSVERRMLSSKGLSEIAGYAAVLAPNHRLLFDDEPGDRPATTDLVQEARGAGLALHPYTFNNDSLPMYADDLAGFLALVVELVQPEAVFCDYPDIAVTVRARRIHAQS
jgi:glycerophosphoryl diester phosphodiesterase